MKNRILAGWTIQRIFLLLIGTLIMLAAIAARQWLGAVIGLFLAAMGLFGYRSGAGNCYGGSCKPYGSTEDGSCCQQADTVYNSETERQETA